MTDTDLPYFFEQQLDPVANEMAAFAAQDPADGAAFAEKWAKILGGPGGANMTVLVRGQVAGYILSFVAPWSGELEVTYWLGREYWGKGIATAALAQFLQHVRTRPLYARAAKDNSSSVRVLEKCGFTIVGEDKGFANARNEMVEEFVFELRGAVSGATPLDQGTGV